MSQVVIAPSIATGNLLNLGEEVKRCEEAGVEVLHVDLMDGHFVPHLTLGVPVLAAIRKVTQMHLDTHIMVTNPEATFEHYLDAGADTLTFQWEAALHPHRLLGAIQKKEVKAGVAINPGTPPQVLDYVLPFLDQVTVMTVNPGFSNQKHIAEVAQKVSLLNEMRDAKNLSFKIQVDGGVNRENISSLVSMGADILVAGGAIFNHNDYKCAVQELLKGAAQGIS